MKNDSYVKMKSYLIESNIVSFDMFDTLIHRSVLRYEEIFEIVERKIKVLGFKKFRIRAEAAARILGSDMNIVDIKLEDIYRQIHIPDGLKKYAMEVEMETEILFSKPNHRMKEIYKMVKNSGKKVIITTDMYLSRDTLVKMLDKCGYNDYDEIFISSELNMTKRDGSIYNYILSAVNVKANKFIHIGDNYISDFINARKVGINAIHYEEIESVSSENINNEISISIIECLYRDLLMATQKPDPFFVQGFKVLGILLYGYCEWIRNKSKEQNISKLYFSSRDGFIVKKAWELLYPNDTEFEIHYIYGSRYSFEIASLDTDDDALLVENIYLVLKGRGLLRGNKIEDILTLLGMKDHIKNITVDINKYINSDKDIDQLKSLLYANINVIKTYANIQKQNIENYLDSISFYEDERVGLIDLGWRGRVQHSLEKVIQNNKSKPHIFGMYLFLSNEEITKEIMKHCSLDAYICGPHKNVELADWPVREMDFIEIFFTAPHGTVTEFRDNGLGIIAVFEENEKEINQYNSTIIQIHSGSLAFISEYAELSRYFNNEISPYVAIQPFEKLALNCTSNDARLFGALELFDRKDNINGRKVYLARIPTMYELINLLYKKIRGDTLSLFKWKKGFKKNMKRYPIVFIVYCGYIVLSSCISSFKLIKIKLFNLLRKTKKRIILIKTILS